MTYLLCDICTCPLGVKGLAPAIKVDTDRYVHQNWCPTFMLAHKIRKAYGLEVSSEEAPA